MEDNYKNFRELEHWKNQVSTAVTLMTLICQCNYSSSSPRLSADIDMSRSLPVMRLYNSSTSFAMVSK